MPLTAVVVDDPDGLVAGEPFDLIPLEELGIDNAEQCAADGPSALARSARPRLVSRLVRDGLDVAYLAPETRLLGFVDWEAHEPGSLGPEHEPTLVLAPASARSAIEDWCRTGTPPPGPAPPGVIRLADRNGPPSRDPRTAVVDFSGMDLSRPPRDNPWAATLVSDYARDLDRAGHGEVSRLAYGRGLLADAGPLGLILRRLASARGEGRFSLATEEGVAELLEWAAEPAAADGPVNRFVHALWRERPDLQAAFPDPLGADGAGLVRWVLEDGRDQIDMPEAVRPAQLAGGAIAAPLDAAPGVNVVGLLHSETGLGEAARRVIEALDAGGVRVLPVDSAVGSAVRAEMEFASVDPAEAAFDVNLVCLNGDALLQFAAQAGENFFAGRHTIGMWFWELPELPAEWSGALDLVDELWAASRSMAEHLSATTSVPVRHMPLPVVVPPAEPFRRDDHGIPEGDFVFLFAFDLNSTIARKNPLGLIDAFTAAFGPGEGASLVIKTINSASQIGDAERLAIAASRHEHVRLLDRMMSAREMAGLTMGADCYISLHRAEGFGLTIADAMYVGKPVIATAYGGNLDFANEGNSYPVGYTLTRVGPGATPYPPDGVWAEPDLDQAARAMRRVFEHRDEATARAERGREDVVRTHSALAVGRRMRARLSESPGARREPRAPGPSLGSTRAVGIADALRGDPPPPDSGMRGVVKRVVLRLIRPHTRWQLEQNRRTADALAALADAGGAVEKRVESLEAEANRLAGMQSRLRADLLALRRRQERAARERPY
jgi:glycosyltransferase involved in cell wall biosynthesis